jgi:hypothetical protein
VIVYIKVVFFNRRAQKLGLIFILAAVPLFLIYYDDRFRGIPGLSRFQMRSWAEPLVNNYQNLSRFDPKFVSSIAPAIIVAIILLVHLIVVQRLAARPQLVRIANLTATFFAGATAATMVGGIIDSTFHLGWVGGVIIGFIFALVYLGALALFLALLELIVALSRLAVAWIKRKIFAVATLITRAANFVSSLGGRMVSRALIERINAETSAQEGTFIREQDDQDRALLEAYIRDLDRKRQARLKAHREKYGDDDSIADLRAIISPVPPSDDTPVPAPRLAEPTVPASDPFAPTASATAETTTEAFAFGTEPTTQQQ